MNLLKCPCCDFSGVLQQEEDELSSRIHPDADGWWTVTCAGCGMQTDGTKTSAEAVELWNTRIPVSQGMIYQVLEIINNEPEFPDDNDYGPAAGWAKTAPIDVAKIACRLTKEALVEKVKNLNPKGLDIDAILDKTLGVPSWSSEDFDKGWEAAVTYIREEITYALTEK